MLNYGPQNFPAVGGGLPGLPRRGTVPSAVVSIPNITTPYVRNSDWPTEVFPEAGVQKFTGLLAVHDHSSNFIAFQFSGAVTIDWGDGSSTENVAAATQAERNLVYANIPGTIVGSSKTTAVTFTDVGDLVNCTAHNFNDNQPINFATINSTTGISVNTTYYVVNKTTNNFQVSATRGGSAIILTTDGSGTAYIPEYKVAVITVTPQAANNITSIDLQKKHSQAGLQAYATNWLDITINSTSLTSLIISAATLTTRLNDLTCVKLGENAVIDFSNMFNACYSLQSVPLFNTAAGTNFTSMFSGCNALQSVPLLNTAAGTNFTSMFNACYSLQSVPLFNTAAGTNFSDMFNACYSLQSVPLFNTAAGTNFSYMFSGCTALQSVPLLNTAAGTNFSFMFNSCYSLQSVPLFNTAAGTNFGNMFNACFSLQSVPLFNTAAGTNFGNMFQSCYSLQSVPLLNTAAGTNFTSMFYWCSSLQSVPLFNTAAGTTFSNMFQNCFSLQSVPLFNTAAGTDFSNMFNACYSLQSVPLLNTAVGTNFSFMFSNCSSLQSVPLFNTAAGTAFNSMFQGCYSLQSVPLFNTAAGTNFSSMFNTCISLQSVPLLNLNAATGSTNLFASCPSLAKATIKSPGISWSVANCKLSADALNDIYVNLKTGVTAKVLTVTGNYGTTGDNPALVPAGWTVTG